MKAALLVIDMQEFFRSIADPVIENVCNVIRRCREKGMPIAFTQHGHVKDDLGSLGRFWGPDSDHIRFQSEEWKLLREIEELFVRSDDISITSKRTYDSFHNTELESELRERGVDTVIICGVMTNLCCETTARSAFVRNFDVLFLDDGCATANQNLHGCTIQNIRFGFGHVWKCKKLIADYLSD